MQRARPEGPDRNAPPLAGARPESRGRTGQFKTVTIEKFACSIKNLTPLSAKAPVQLLQTPDNPIPSKPVVMQVKAQDGVPLRVVRWRPTARRVRGTVCILQGRAEFIERYFETI